MYDVHLGLIGKGVVDFLLVFIEVFSLGVMAEALRAKLDLKNRRFRCNTVSLNYHFRRRGCSTSNHFCTCS